ncbi:MAG TPA: F0F1 ATP synthase subunit delta [Verrucomicrobiae bacterium]|nr:F0F1 ATP synthase subunit delta [Verrucomicrobiae bacterium]
MSSTKAFIASILDQFYRAEQVDLLHLALTNVLEMVSAGEVDIFLDQRQKNASQKKAFVQKIIGSIESPELKSAFQAELDADNLEFFRERSLGTTLSLLQRETEKIKIVRLHVALEFKEKDFREMVALLEEQLNAKVALSISVERSLLGGAIIQYGTALRDSTLKSRLEVFREHWKQAAVEA